MKIEEIRSKGIKNEVRRLKKLEVREDQRSIDIARCYNYADRIGAKRAIFVAPDEWARGEVRLKELREGGKDKEINIAFTDL